jgi:hypothetical protein
MRDDAANESSTLRPSRITNRRVVETANTEIAHGKCPSIEMLPNHNARTESVRHPKTERQKGAKSPGWTVSD